MMSDVGARATTVSPPEDQLTVAEVTLPMQQEPGHESGPPRLEVVNLDVGFVATSEEVAANAEVADVIEDLTEVEETAAPVATEKGKNVYNCLYK